MLSAVASIWMSRVRVAPQFPAASIARTWNVVVPLASAPDVRNALFTSTEQSGTPVVLYEYPTMGDTDTAVVHSMYGVFRLIQSPTMNGVPPALGRTVIDVTASLFLSTKSVVV